MAQKAARNPFAKKVQKENLEKYFSNILPHLHASEAFATFLQRRLGDAIRKKQRLGKPPKSIDDFDLLSVIGQGCMGKV
jgi:hypothetical protein